MDKASQDLLPTQLRILFGNSRVLSLGHMLLATSLLYVLWDSVPGNWLLLWYGIVCLTVAYRLGLNYCYQRASAQPTEKWQRLYLTCSFVSGMVWGCLGLFPTPENFYYLILVTIGSVSAATIASSTVYMPAFLLFFWPLVLPLTIRIWLDSNAAMNFLPMASAIFLVVMTMLSRAQNKAAVKSIRLRFENLELVQQLTEQKDELTSNRAELIEARNKAEQANVAKSRFLAAASHDLRQPLHSLGLYIGALSHSESEEERQTLYPKLQRSLESLSELFEALLDISKLDAASVTIQKKPVAVSPVLRKLIDEHENQAREKGNALKLLINKPVTIKTDTLWLERILRNLLSNALRYTDGGKILVTCRGIGKNCLIQVWDSGRGIARDQQEAIFEEFKQLHNPQRLRNQGLGLGLAIVKRLVNLLGHSVSVRSEEGRGSVFSVLVPTTDEPVTLMHQTPVSDQFNRLTNKRVLLIDDEQEVRVAMEQLLTKWGCEVHLADSLENALELIKTNGIFPDVLISDYRLSEDKTGIDVIRSVNSFFEKDIAAMLVTGDTKPDIIKAINESGFPVLYKPVQPAKLRVMLNSLCLQEA